MKASTSDILAHVPPQQCPRHYEPGSSINEDVVIFLGLVNCNPVQRLVRMVVSEASDPQSLRSCKYYCYKFLNHWAQQASHRHLNCNYPVQVSYSICLKQISTVDIIYTHTCIYIYIYIFIYIYISIYLYTFISISLSIYLYILKCTVIW